MMANSSMEMQKTTRLIEEAREQAYMKMQDAAYEKNADAIVAVASDCNIGNDIIHISMYGTAVKIISEDKYEEQLRQTEAKRKAENDAKQQRLQEIKDRRELSGMTLEKELMQEINSADSFHKIMLIWEEYKLSDAYPDVDGIIRSNYNIERLYGRISKIDDLKKEIENLLLHA